MTTQPLFSVLIANYNNGRYLMGSIESVRQQTYANWEIVLVDDGSIDNSEEFYKELEKDSRIHIFRNGKNMGCGFTKRRCVEESKGELCGFLDPDDEILPNALQVMVETHREHPEVSLVTSRYYLCDENLNPYRESRQLVIPEGKDFFTLAAYSAEVFSAFKRSVYDRTDGISTQYHLGVDQDLYFKLEEVAPILPINELTYKYRIYSGSISNNELRARYWNMIIHHDVCLRRGLNPDEYSFKDMFVIQNYCQDQVRKSAAYRLGRTILMPINGIKHILQRSKKEL